MALRVCNEPECPVLVESGRCAEHRRAFEVRRGSKRDRGYDAEFKAERKRLVRRLAAGEVLTCWRCGRVVMPHELSLGHCDDDRSILHGAEHLRQCNLANTRGGCPHPMHAGISPDAYEGGGGPSVPAR